MNKTFTINEKEYSAKPFDFNMVCDMEDMNVSLEEMSKKRMSVMRAYFALCANKSNADAGKELEQHFVAGNTLEELGKIMNEEMEKSDFFRTLFKKEEAEVAENPSEEKQDSKK